MSCRPKLLWASSLSSRRDGAEKTVHRLSYKSFDDLASTLSSRLGFALFEDETDLETIRDVVEIRNVLTHNRGVVNKIFVRRVPKYASHVGSRIPLTVDEIGAGIDMLTRSVVDIERRAVEKFDLSNGMITRDQVAMRIAARLSERVTK